MYWVLVRTAPYRYELATSQAFSSYEEAFDYAAQVAFPYTIVQPSTSSQLEA